MPQPDLKFDIDALFKHLTSNLGHELDQPMDWHFDFRSDDLAHLERLAERLSDEFNVELQESVETIEGDKTFMGPPMMTIVVREALKPAAVKGYANRFADLAKAEKIKYEGVSVFDPTDLEELFGWLNLEDAVWRLRHFTDNGLEEGEELPYIFAIQADDAGHIKKIVRSLREAGFDRVEILDDEDEDMGVVVNVDGKNDEKHLTASYKKIDAVAQAAKAELLGMQFDDAEDDDEDDEDDEGDDDEK